SGLRPGEKMYEELFYESEVREETSHSKILLAKHSVTNLKDLNDKIDEIINSVEEFDNEKIKSILKGLVPFIESPQENVIPFNQHKA
ncbi:MAG: polysaccharide biosynthesis protein, partial [Proteobacteria bacterium]|nr:polysaccharide biosynthesis protein [Pseudomonadota bacterium]